jgi:integration host factor subunit beta
MKGFVRIDIHPIILYAFDIFNISRWCKGVFMNKLDLIEELRNKTELNTSEARRVVDLFFDEISNTLANGDRVEIRGFCSFYVKNYKAYTGRNPKTGEQARVKPKKLPFFKVGKKLKERVDCQG